MLAREVKKELTEHIIPFWNKLEDIERGGFYGYMGNDLKPDKNAVKGVILHSRILWFYSNCYLVLGDEGCLEKAEQCYDFMVKTCVDPQYGGAYWSVNADGTPADDMKHTYCQAFFIYALSSYFDASRDDSALKLALKMFETVEKNCTDSVGYLEAMSRKWEVIENDALSENGLMADKTMNTALHLIEAYTELYRVSKDWRAAKRLKFLLEMTLEKIYSPEKKQLLVFFDKEMKVIGDIHSYGHDIEATWILDKACEVLGDNEMTSKITKMNKKIVANIAAIAYKDGSLLNERDNDKINTWRVWWVQAEAVVGFLNAYKKYGNADYMDISRSVWEYIKEHIIDKREGGEWFSQVDENGVPADFKAVVDEWKCPYHNGRMCLEVIKRS